MSDLADIKVSVDNNLFSPQAGSRKRKLECDENINPLRDDGIELVLANFAEGTSGADIFKLLDPYNVAASLSGCTVWTRQRRPSGRWMASLCLTGQSLKNAKSVCLLIN